MFYTWKQFRKRLILSGERSCPFYCLFNSSPEPLGLQGELIVYPWSGVRLPSVGRRPQCSNIFFSKTAWRIKAKFYAEPPWVGGTNFVRGIWVTWPRWPPTPYTVKTLKNLLLQNQKSYDLETWRVASGIPALQTLYKWWPWVDHDLFYGKVRFGNLGFSIGKSEKIGFFRNYCSKWPERW